MSIEKLAEGIIQIKTGQFIPDSERLFHTEKYITRLKKFDEWMDKREPEESNLDELLPDKEK